MDRKDARDIYSVIQDSFDIKEVDIRTYSPLALAFMGDCVFDLIIRSIVVGEGNRQASKLHNKKSQIVKAATQAAMADAIEGGLLEDEADVYRRGKNAHTMSKAKNATDMDYHKATGFEALLGYLYLTHKQDRIMELVKEALSRTDGGRYEI
jgi:ribonuclease-3 family protein